MNLRPGIGAEALVPHELKAYGQRMFEWQNQKRLLRQWMAEAETAADKAMIRLLQRAIVDHNAGRPTREDRTAARHAYRERVATYYADPSNAAEALAYRRFVEMDRLMRGRYGVPL